MARSEATGGEVGSARRSVAWAGLRGGAEGRAEGAEGGEGGGGAEDCFLVGHSLENDLRALELAWPRVLDTALLYPLKHRLEGPPAKARASPPAAC